MHTDAQHLLSRRCFVFCCIVTVSCYCVATDELACNSRSPKGRRRNLSVVLLLQMQLVGSLGPAVLPVTLEILRGESDSSQLILQKCYMSLEQCIKTFESMALSSCFNSSLHLIIASFYSIGEHWLTIQGISKEY